MAEAATGHQGFESGPAGAAGLAGVRATLRNWTRQNGLMCSHYQALRDRAKFETAFNVKLR